MVADHSVPAVAAPTETLERASALALVGAIALVAAGYGVYWIRHLVLLPPEFTWLLALDSDVRPPFAWVLRAWSGLAGSAAADLRALSLVMMAASLALTTSIAVRLSADRLVGAALALSFILYPPLVATYVTATPHAMFAAALLAILEILSRRQPSGHAWLLPAGVAGVIGAGAMTLAPEAAAVVVLWFVYAALLLEAGQRRAALGGLVLSSVLGLALVPGLASIDNEVDLTAAGYDGLVRALVFPFAMVVVGGLLAGLAAVSPQVRARVGTRRLAVVLAGPLVAAGWLVLTGNGDQPGRLVTAAGYVFPFVVLAPWPLAMWVCRVMPQVRALTAWLAFPVIMYSCFWVVLGPVKADRFPYTHRAEPVSPAGE